MENTSGNLPYQPGFVWTKPPAHQAPPPRPLEPKPRVTGPCPNCGSRNFVQTVSLDPNARDRRTCADCGKWLRWVRQPWSRARAEQFVIPFGPHRGRSIGELGGTIHGRRHLERLTKTARGNELIAALIVLGKLKLGAEFAFVSIEKC